jgi:glycosyltransferase involved in cell wall biosynthesis
VSAPELRAATSPVPAGRPGLLLVGNFLSKAGGSRHVCEELAERLTRAGWNVRTASHKRPKLPRLLDMAGAVWRGRRSEEVVHVDVFSGEAFLWAAAVVGLLRSLGKRYLLTLRGGSLPEFAARWPFAVRRLLAGADAVTVPSGFLLREMRPYRADLILLPNPLDLASYPYSHRRRAAPRMIWLRAFHETYNPSLGPRVLALLARDFPEATLTMIGPDRGDGSLARTREAAARLGVSDRLRIVEGIPKSEVGRSLADADVFLNTTNVDNAPVSVLEAMACGLCVVSTNVGGMPDYLRDESEGLLVPPDDPEAMASAVRRIVSDPETAGRISRGGRGRAEAMDWSIVLPRWESLFTGTPDRSPKPC